MNGTQAHAIHGMARGTALGRLASGSIMEAVVAIGAIVLSIIGLAGMLSNVMAAIATIIIGGALLVEGGAIGSDYGRLISESREESGGFDAVELGGGLTAEFLGGIAGIVLGILALFGTAPTVLMPAAVIVFGAALLLGSAAAAELNWVANTPTGQPANETVRGATTAASGGHVMVGLSALVLGILAVIGITPLVLTLVALLALGTAMLFSGSALGSRTIAVARR